MRLAYNRRMSENEKRQQPTSAQRSLALPPVKITPLRIVLLVALLVAVIFGVRFCSTAATINVTVNGSACTLHGAKTMQTAIKESGLPINPGDLISLTGKLLKALLRYAENGEEPDFSDDKAIMLMFSMMSRRIDRDFERYSKVCEKRSEVGKKGGAPKGNANAARNPKQAKTTKTTQTETETKTETKTETDTEAETYTETEHIHSCFGLKPDDREFFG